MRPAFQSVSALPDLRFQQVPRQRLEGAPIILIRAGPSDDAGLPDAEPDDGYRLQEEKQK